MSVYKWHQASPEMVLECERQYRATGAHVFTYIGPPHRHLMPSHMTTQRTLRNAKAGTIVYAKRAYQGCYQWMQTRPLS